MPRQSYALEPNGPKRLSISWKGFWRDVSITVDGKTVGKIADAKSLGEGQEFKLTDHSVLKIQLVRKFTASELLVLRNGKPLPGSSSDPHTRLRTSYWLIWFIGGMDLLLGILALAFHLSALQDFGFGAASIIYGLIFLLLGYFVRRLSVFAITLAITLLFVEGITSILLGGTQGSSPGFLGIMARLILMVPLAQGIGAMRQLNQIDDAEGKR